MAQGAACTPNAFLPGRTPCFEKFPLLRGLSMTKGVKEKTAAQGG